MPQKNLQQIPIRKTKQRIVFFFKKLPHKLIVSQLEKEELFTVYERMLAENRHLEKQIEAVKEQLKNCPEGKIFCVRDGKRIKWFHSNENGQIYIPKTKRAFAEALAVKKYLLLRLDELTQEKRAIDFYLRHHDSSPGKSIRLLNDFPEYQDLLSPHFKPLSQELAEWMAAPYEHNPKNPEHLIHKCSSGNHVRSKSEVLIDMMLYTHAIPFRYECALHLGGTTFFPDFTIRHPNTGETYYWEHFGMMDDADYSRSAFSKLQFYTEHGIVPSIQLIATYETREHPLTLETIEKVTKEYFLS